MKKHLFFVLIALGISTATQAQDDKKWTPDLVVNTEYLSGAVFSPKNDLVVWGKTRAAKDKDKFVTNLHLTRLDSKKDGKFRSIALTNQDESESDPLFSADGETIYFLSSRAEGKKLWSMSIFGGEPQAVHEFKNGISNLSWLNDSTLVFTANEGETLLEAETKEKKDDVEVVEDTTHFKASRLFTFNTKSKSIRRLSDNKYQVGEYAVAPNGEWIVYRLIRSPHFGIDGLPRPTIHLLNVKTGESKQILGYNLSESNFKFSLDNQGFYYTILLSSNPNYQMAGVNELRYFQLSSNTSSTVPLNWERKMEGTYHVVAKGVIVTLPNGATNKLAFYQKSGSVWQQIDLKMGDKAEHVSLRSVSDDGTKMAYEYSTASTMPAFFVADLKDTSLVNEAELCKLNENLAALPKARSEVVKWKGYKNEEVTGILYYPENYQAGKRYPLVLSIHGGPHGADLDAWDENWASYAHILSQRGAFTLKPNYHGSSNHGQAFAETIRENYYEPEIEDVTKGIEFLDQKGLIDKKQMGVMGWSNGAIISTMLIVRYPDLFKFCAPGAGDVNWTSDYGTCEFGVSFDQYYFGGAPWDDRNGKNYNENYILKSPLFELEKVKTPTILFHGSEDRAVPRDQSWEYYRALQQVGKAPVKFLWFPGQPHGLQKITHQLRKMNEELAWIDKYLFSKKDEKNEAFKAESPLALLIERDSSATYQGQYGVWSNGKLLPEVVLVKKDSISIGRFEVTKAQFKQFDPKYTYPAGQDNHAAPVSFEQSKAYVAWLAKLTGKKYRLPNASEAKDWHKSAHESAAKENTLNYWAGYAITKEEVPLLLQKLSSVKTSLFKEVGTFAAIKIGQAEVYDLGGNLAEYQAEGSSYGWSAYDFVDANSEKVSPAKGNVGFRLVLGK
jgi:dipeptidyl aminopeptidase/acylaminoacyl peptidase